MTFWSYLLSPPSGEVHTFSKHIGGNQNSWYQMGDMKQVLYWGCTNTRCHHIKFCHPSGLAHGTCAPICSGCLQSVISHDSNFHNFTRLKSRQWTKVSDSCMPQDKCPVSENGSKQETPNCYWQWNRTCLPCSRSLLTEPAQALISVDNSHIFHLQMPPVNLDNWMPLKLCISYTHIWPLPTVHQMDRRS
jgi:hypothetical protein